MTILIQFLVTAGAMTALVLLWFGMQRWLRTSDECDYLEGRWGCADCDDTSCVLKPQSPTP